jgi:hypothetical protein
MARRDCPPTSAAGASMVAAAAKGSPGCSMGLLGFGSDGCLGERSGRIYPVFIWNL